MYSTEDPHDDILERLRHPEREQQRRAPQRLFLIRNALNTVFILMAVIAMIGIAVSWTTGGGARGFYLLGLAAVLVKMIETLLRMPGMTKVWKPAPRRHLDTTATNTTESASQEATPDDGDNATSQNK